MAASPSTAHTQHTTHSSQHNTTKSRKTYTYTHTIHTAAHHCLTCYDRLLHSDRHPYRLPVRQRPFPRCVRDTVFVSLVCCWCSLLGCAVLPLLVLESSLSSWVFFAVSFVVGRHVVHAWSDDLHLRHPQWSVATAAHSLAQRRLFSSLPPPLVCRAPPSTSRCGRAVLVCDRLSRIHSAPCFFAPPLFRSFPARS